MPQEYELNNGEIRVWVEQGQSVCIKAVTKEGDPVEITGKEALKLAKILEEFGAKADE